MEFNTALNSILSAKGVKAADIHKKTGLKRPYLSKMINGEMIPSTYNIVEQIMDAAGFSLDERIVLTNAYQLSRSTADEKPLWSSFRDMYSLKYPECPAVSFTGTEGIAEAALLEGGELLNAAGSLMKECKGQLRLFFAPVEESSVSSFCSCFNALPENAGIVWLLPFDRSAGADIINYSVMVNCLPIMTVRACAVIKTDCVLEYCLNNTVFPFLMMTDDALLLFDAKMQKGQFFRNREQIKLYAERIFSRCGSSEPFFMSFDRPETIAYFLSSQITAKMEGGFDYYTFATVPCVVFDIAPTEIMKYKAEEIADSRTAALYIEFLNFILQNARSFTDVFSLRGLERYLDEEEWYELGKHLTNSFSKEFRYKALEQSMGNTDTNTNYEALGLKIPGFDNCAFIGANIMSTGYLILLYSFDEKPAIFIANEKSITDMLINYICSLKKHGLIKSNDETVEHVKMELDKRKSGSITAGL